MRLTMILHFRPIQSSVSQIAMLINESKLVLYRLAIVSKLNQTKYYMALLLMDAKSWVHACLAKNANLGGIGHIVTSIRCVDVRTN